MSIFKKPKVGRRFFLRGAGATAIGLPLMEFMLNNHGNAYADGGDLPCRFVSFFCPTSLVGSGGNFDDDRFIPDQAGRNYDLKTCLEPLGERGIHEDVSAISNLFSPPVDAPGGYKSDYHGQGPQTLFTGARHGWLEPIWRPHAPSVDVVIAKALGDEPLLYQIDGAAAPDSPSIAERPDGTFGWVEAQRSPAAAYRSLVTSLAPTDPDPSQTLEQRLRVSSLSYASDQITALQSRLGAADKLRLEEHLTAVRSLETRLAAAGMPTTSACMDPGQLEDPADISGTVPDQAARALLFNDLAALAVACNITRSIVICGSGQWTGSGMRHQLWADKGGLHADVQHTGGQANLVPANRWFVEQYADLVSKIKAIDEMGTSALDRSAVVFFMEGGKGTIDPLRDGDGGGDINHSTDNMITLVAGRAGGLAAGQHIIAPKDTHPVAVFNTVMQAIGVNETMGDITTTLPGMFES